MICGARGEIGSVRWGKERDSPNVSRSNLDLHLDESVVHLGFSKF